jgi:serine/threonine-protein kinase
MAPRGIIKKPADPTSIALGREMVGRYEIIYPIAHGGMATVYVGRLPGMAGFEKLFAIKVIHPHLAAEKDFIEMFLDEARLAARIHHPNVAEISEVGEDEGLLFMVGELVLGQNLYLMHRRSLEIGMLIPQSIIAHIASNVCLGLHAAHELRDPHGRPLNLVHRDISPHNVLVAYNGYVKLIDFGVAFAQERLTHTSSGLVKGKIGFMSPEQVGGKSLDRRSDLFSLGVALYILTTNQQPFRGKNDAATIQRILSGQVTKPSHFNTSLDPSLEQIILRALELPREDRYQTAAEMGRDLEEFARASDKTIGSEKLAGLMHQLFEADVYDHEEKIHAHRKRRDAPSDGKLDPKKEAQAETAQYARPSGASIKTATDDASGKSGPIESSVTALEQVTTEDSPAAIASRGRRRLSRGTAAILIASGGWVIAIVLIALFWHSLTSPLDPVSPSTPEETPDESIMPLEAAPVEVGEPAPAEQEDSQASITVEPEALPPVDIDFDIEPDAGPENEAPASKAKAKPKAKPKATKTPKGKPKPAAKKQPKGGDLPMEDPY